MKVISCNIATPKEIDWKGKKVKTGIFKKPINQPIYLGKEDVGNDNVIDRRYHGGIDKACYLFSEDHYTYWKEKYPELDWGLGMFGENLTMAGMDEADILIGDIYKLGEAMVQVTQPRQPCFKLGIRFGTQKMVKEFIESGHSGVYVRVLKEGAVKKGDSMVSIKKATVSMSVREIFNLLYVDISKIDDAKKAIAIKDLAKSCRRDLCKHYRIKEH